MKLLNNTLVGPLGRCVGASDHALFVCLFCGCVLNSVHLINVTFPFGHYNEVVMFVMHSIRFPASLIVLLGLVDPMGMLRPHITETWR